MQYISALPATQVKSAIAAGTTTTITCPENATQHQLKLNKDSATSGTIAVSFKSLGATTAETLYDAYGTAVVFNCATSTAQTIGVSSQNGAAISEIILTPSALNGTYKFAYSGW